MAQGSNWRLNAILEETTWEENSWVCKTHAYAASTNFMLLCCPCICYSLQWVQYLVVPYHYLDKWRLSYCEVPDWHHLERDAQSRKYKFQSEIHEWVCADQAIITILAEPLQDASFNQPSPNSFNDIQEHFSKQVGKINRIGHLQIGLRPADLPGIVLLHHCGIRFIRVKQFRICKSIMPRF